MITVEEARSIVSNNISVLDPMLVTTEKALGYVLAEDVYSDIDMPPFPQSAMDGYALGEGDRNAGSEFLVIGESAAGNNTEFSLKAGEAIRIFTGAPVPETAVAVVQQEWVDVKENGIILTKDVAAHMHIRPQGEQLNRGEMALKKGTLVNAAAVGFLAMIGTTEVSVFKKPVVEVLVTGNELVKPGSSLKYGQIFESNSAMLVAALLTEGCGAKSVSVPDDLEQTKAAISEALNHCDLLILSGGISVGDHDHVGTALNELGVKQGFYKVKQKPGKPIYFGTFGSKLIFALPGNPAASLSCFYEYVVPAMRKMQSHPQSELPILKLPISSSFTKKGERAQFLKAMIRNSKVEILEGQSSAMLHTFAMADALVYIPLEKEFVEEGELVEVRLLG